MVSLHFSNGRLKLSEATISRLSQEQMCEFPNDFVAW